MKNYQECDGWKNTICCSVPFYTDSDVCSKCLEHTDVICADCEDFKECDNDNKILIQKID